MDEKHAKLLTTGVAGLLLLVLGWLWISAHAVNAAEGGGTRVYLPLVVVEPTPIATATPTASPSPLPTETATASPTPGQTATALPSPQPNETATPSPTLTRTPRPTSTNSPQPSPTATASPTSPATQTPRPTSTSSPQPSPTATASATSTATQTPLPATQTPTVTQTPPPTRTPTATNTATQTPTATASSTPATGGQFSITGLEVTQSIQTLSNSVPLVADRPTLVRVYVESNTGAALNNQVVRLTGRRGSTTLGPLTTAPQTAPLQSSRSNYGSTFNFILPADWLNGTVELTAAGPANSQTQTVQFNEVPPLDVKIVPIRYTHTGSTRPGFYPAVFEDKFSDWTMRVYPIPELQVSFFNSGYDFTGNLQSSSEWSRILGEINTLKSTQNGARGQIWFGFVPSVNSSGQWFRSGVVGIGYIGSRTSIGLDFGGSNPGTGTTAAHEFGHNLNRPHAPCGTSGSDWPSDAKYSEARIGEFGVDGIGTGSPSLLDPTRYRDLMSYCGPEWISDWTYTKLYNDQRSRGALLRALSTQSILVRAEIDPSGAIEMQPVYLLQATPTDQAGSGDYRVDLLNEQGQIIATYYVPVLIADEPGISVRSIHAVLPAPSEGLASVRISEVNGPNSSQQPLAGVQIAGAIKPQLTQTADLISLDWGLAGQPALVRYTADGGQSWISLAADLTTGRLEIEPDSLPGGLGYFEVILADSGLNLRADLETPLPDKPPLAWITGPTLVEAGSFATLYGYGTDVEDGALTDRRWSIDGVPVEAKAWVSLAELLPGEHVITMTVRDRAGQTATTGQTVTVTP